MNFARHLLRRTTTVFARPIILPVAAPLRVVSTPIPRVFQIIPRLQQQQIVQQPQKRHESTAIGSIPVSGSSADKEASKEVKPSYDLTFTCRPCGHRSTHNVSKQGYHYGSVLITCPGCHNRHVISDHLKIFGETSRSFEEILEQSGSGETIRKYTAAQRSYKEQLDAEDTLRSRGIWSEGGNHVEVLPEGNEAGARPTEESWQNGLDAGGRNVYPDPEIEEEVEGGSTAGVDGGRASDDLPGRTT